MTESDVKNMLAAASTLDTEGQTPQELKDELERVQESSKSSFQTTNHK